MGADEIEVDPAELPGVAGQLSDIQSKIDTILDTLQNSTEHRGAPWGNDSYGNKFYCGGADDEGYGANYTGPNGVVPATRGVSGTFGRAAELLRQAARTLADTESGSADNFGSGHD